jgi:hypothetical protein
MAVIPILSVSPYIWPRKGGVVISISASAGGFSTSGSYVVYIGPNGTIADAPCYSGVIGNAYACTPESAILLKCVTPPLDRDSDLYLTVVSGADSGQLHSSCGIPALMAIEDSYFDQLFETRKHWTRWYDTGPRGLDLEPRQDT